MIITLLNWMFPERQMIEEWNEKFPNQCLICGFQAYGYANGMTSDLTPPPHDCIYAKRQNHTTVAQ